MLDSIREDSLTMEGDWPWGPLALPSSCDVAAPNYLHPSVASFLWCQPYYSAGGGLIRKSMRAPNWQRRFVVQSANFLYMFAKADDAKPPTAKPVEVLCFEDLVFDASPITDAEVAKVPDLFMHSEFGFGLHPAELSVASLSDALRSGRGYRFCAESAVLLGKWAVVLKRAQHVQMRSELYRLQQELECKDVEVRELKRLLCEADPEAERSARDAGLGGAPAAAVGGMPPPPPRRQATEEEIQEASIKLQAATRGRIVRQHTGSLREPSGDKSRKMSAHRPFVPLPLHRPLHRPLHSPFTTPLPLHTPLTFAQPLSSAPCTGTDTCHRPLPRVHTFRSVVAFGSAITGMGAAVAGGLGKTAEATGKGLFAAAETVGRGAEAVGRGVSTVVLSAGHREESSVSGHPPHSTSMPPSSPAAETAGGSSTAADERAALGLAPLGDRPDGSRADGSERTAVGAGKAADEAMSALHERGEKLQSLAGVTGQLADDAESFADQAKRIRQQAEKQSSLWPFG